MKKIMPSASECMKNQNHKIDDKRDVKMRNIISAIYISLHSPNI